MVNGSGQFGCVFWTAVGIVPSTAMFSVFDMVASMRDDGIPIPADFIAELGEEHSSDDSDDDADGSDDGSLGDSDLSDL